MSVRLPYVDLDDYALRMAVQSVCPGTHKEYEGRFRSWQEFTELYDEPLWIHEYSHEEQASTLVRFIAYLASVRENQWGTIKGKISAVRFMHRINHHCELVKESPFLSLVEKGGRLQLDNSRPWKPVSIRMIRSMLARVKSNVTGPNMILCGGIVLGFFFLERGGELWGTAGKALEMSELILWVGDGVQWNGHNGQPVSVSVTWLNDKTNTNATMMLFRSGDPDFCPVAATMMLYSGRKWVQARSSRPLARTVVAGTKRAEAISWIKTAARECGAPEEDMDRYALHSLRVGGTTVLAEAGCCEMLIRLHGRWRSNTNRRYTRRSTGTFVGVSAMMLGTEAALNAEWGRGGRSS